MPSVDVILILLRKFITDRHHVRSALLVHAVTKTNKVVVLSSHYLALVGLQQLLNVLLLVPTSSLEPHFSSRASWKCRQSDRILPSVIRTFNLIRSFIKLLVPRFIIPRRTVRVHGFSKHTFLFLLVNSISKLDSLQNQFIAQRPDFRVFIFQDCADFKQLDAFLFPDWSYRSIVALKHF